MLPVRGKTTTSAAKATQPIGAVSATSMSFSLNEELRVLQGRVGVITVSCEPPYSAIGVDLLAGVEEYQVSKYRPSLVLLEYLRLEHPHGTPLPEALPNIRFVCNRNVLRLLAQIPWGHQFHLEWNLVVERYGNVLGIMVQNQKYSFSVSKQQRFMGDHLPLRLAIPDSADPERPRSVPNDWQHFIVNQLESRTGTILYNAEIDAIATDEALVEIKALGSTPAFCLMPSRKAFNWWLQNRFGGVDRTLVGVHDNGILREVYLLSAADLLKLCQKDFNVEEADKSLQRVLGKIEAKARLIGPNEQLLVNWKDGKLEFFSQPTAGHTPVFQNEFKSHFPLH